MNILRPRSTSIPKCEQPLRDIYYYLSMVPMSVSFIPPSQTAQETLWGMAELSLSLTWGKPIGTPYSPEGDKDDDANKQLKQRQQMAGLLALCQPPQLGRQYASVIFISIGYDSCEWCRQSWLLAEPGRGPGHTSDSQSMVPEGKPWACRRLILQW